MQGTINSSDEQKTIFTWSNLGKTFKLGKSWQVLRQHGRIGWLGAQLIIATRPMSWGNFLNFWGFFLKIWKVFSKRWKRFRQGSRNYDLDKRILLVLTRCVIYAESAGGKTLLAVKLQKPFWHNAFVRQIQDNCQKWIFILKVTEVNFKISCDVCWWKYGRQTLYFPDELWLRHWV